MQHLSCVAPYREGFLARAWIPNEHPEWFLIALIPASWGTREALPMAHRMGEEQPCPEPWGLLQCRAGWAQLQDCPHHLALHSRHGARALLLSDPGSRPSILEDGPLSPSRTYESPKKHLKSILDDRDETICRTCPALLWSYARAIHTSSLIPPSHPIPALL